MNKKINCKLSKNKNSPKCNKRYKVLKLNQYFGGRDNFRIVDTSKEVKDGFHIKKEFESRKNANKYIKEEL